MLSDALKHQIAEAFDPLLNTNFWIVLIGSLVPLGVYLLIKQFRMRGK